MPPADNSGSQPISEDKLYRALAELRLDLMEKMQEVKDAVVPEERVRELAREEMGIASRQAWTARSGVIAAGLFLISISTFFLTVSHGHIP